MESIAKINLYTLILAPGPLSRLSDLKEEGKERAKKKKEKGRRKEEVGREMERRRRGKGGEGRREEKITS